MLTVFSFCCLVLSLALSTLAEGQGTELEEPDLSKVNFFLWTRENGDEPEIFELDPASISNTHFNPDHKVVILIHGWNSYGDSFGADFAPAYLETGDYNVIAIDWGDLETWANYPQAAARSKIVGEYSADLVVLLKELGGEVFNNIHVVGHSLGAHAAGFIGKKVQALGLGKLKRITGLDPALPFFELAGVEGRIHKSDAEFVDIVHTNSGWLWEGCLSIPTAIGHVDFYPAGGVHQPGCIEACIIPDVMCYNITVEDLIKGGCSHGRANDYYIESVVGGQFLGWNCQDWESFQHGDCCGEATALMGEWIDQRVPEGKYYMQVEEESPFSQGEGGSNWCNKYH